MPHLVSLDLSLANSHGSNPSKYFTLPCRAYQISSHHLIILIPPHIFSFPHSLRIYPELIRLNIQLNIPILPTPLLRHFYPPQVLTAMLVYPHHQWQLIANDVMPRSHMYSCPPFMAPHSRDCLYKDTLVLAPCLRYLCWDIMHHLATHE